MNDAFLYLLKRRSFVAVVETDQAEGRRFHCGCVIYIMLTGFHEFDDISHEHTQRCIEFFTLCCMIQLLTNRSCRGSLLNVRDLLITSFSSSVSAWLPMSLALFAV